MIESSHIPIESRQKGKSYQIKCIGYGGAGLTPTSLECI
eukprot:CAMPEP_0113560210 /NCGR_PEP_ID=MMETSP0015_2-20120614/19307_1 /TAXON_ID=2838 /ORGANISM="Odontella" /LENGTH=38 /DNA_ID=CAMNT_0000461895 /DNA_START=198 /DNA_END=314 /DNA_ORIENTATION=+ /assembly_acc=CAM_ASM_000160